MVVYFVKYAKKGKRLYYCKATLGKGAQHESIRRSNLRGGHQKSHGHLRRQVDLRHYGRIARRQATI